jgi:GNAT superfamily N-acetyltransferase
MNRSHLPETSFPIRLRHAADSDREFCSDVLPQPGATSNAISETNPQNIFIMMMGADRIGVVETEGPEADSGLKGFYLVPEYQGQGIGHRLLETFATPLGKSLSHEKDVSLPNEDSLTTRRSSSSWSHIADSSYNEMRRSINRRLLISSEAPLQVASCPS